jgi:hypothetical protein
MKTRLLLFTVSGIAASTSPYFRVFNNRAWLTSLSASLQQVNVRQQAHGPAMDCAQDVYQRQSEFICG